MEWNGAKTIKNGKEALDGNHFQAVGE